MSENLKDILSHLNPDIDQEILLHYLQGKLSSEQQHELEKQMLDNEFGTDALEGLQAFRDKGALSPILQQLKSDLKKKTEKKKRFREKMKLRLDPWLIIAIVMILILAIISYILVHQQLQN